MSHHQTSHEITSSQPTVRRTSARPLPPSKITTATDTADRGKDSQGELVGYFELVIKMCPQERMPYHFREIREGDYLTVKGPKAKRSCVKLDIYRKFSNALVGAVIASVTWIGYEFQHVDSLSGLSDDGDGNLDDDFEKI
ncbi:unnamed protein product [Camellia sinensis]